MNKDNVFSVSEITTHLKNVIESNIPNLFVEGEISNFTHHGSGHIYFSLKDAKASLRCVFFRSYNLQLQFKPKVGDKVVCAGKLSVFERSGSYQLNVTRMLPSGIGELQLKFEELKKKLSAEGLFDEKQKKPIPKFPEKIGVVTSETGAAFQDIKNVLSRRFPCEIYLYPATVQGERAAKEVIRGIEFFNAEKPVDVIIIGRGGGSQEDLFCFNDEALARAIFTSDIPVISAVGHEIDFTISDFVADLRAPTPSAAAELAVPDKAELAEYLRSRVSRLQSLSANHIISKRLKVQNLKAKLYEFHPKLIIQNMQQRIDEATMKMEHLSENILAKYKNKLNILENQLKELSPYEAMKRGYSIIQQQKKIQNSIAGLQKDDELEILFADGTCECKVLATKNTKEARRK